MRKLMTKQYSLEQLCAKVRRLEEAYRTTNWERHMRNMMRPRWDTKEYARRSLAYWQRRLAAAEKRAVEKREATRDVWNTNIRLQANAHGQ